jgi:hypothetical protein
MKGPTLDSGNDAGHDSRPGDAAQPPAIPKKAYQKPVLAKHEQLHGIGIGSP